MKLITPSHNSLLLFLSALFLFSCTHLRHSNTRSEVGEELEGVSGGSKKPLGTDLDQLSPSGDPNSINNENLNSNTGKAYKGMLVRGVSIKNVKFDIPITVNSRVEHWIDYFCGRGRLHFERYLERSEFFIPYITPILRENGLPEDLVYLAMIESGFNNLARSRARAVGPWQFISATGKRYGLSVNWWTDERRDIRKSTLAAVQYLKDLYEIFGSWELSAAAYNAGEAKVARAIQRYGSRDFWVLARHRYLKPETRDYVPKMIAAAILAKNRDQFGFAVNSFEVAEDEAVSPSGELVKVIKTESPEEGVIINPDGSLGLPGEEEHKLGGNTVSDLSTSKDSDDGELSIQNDNEEIITALKPMALIQSNSIAMELIKATPPTPIVPMPAAKSIPTPHVSKDGKVKGEEVVEFDVKSPADLLKIAKAAGLSYLTVKTLNPELMRWCTPPHTEYYRLKLPASTKERFLLTYNQDTFSKEVTFLTYKTKKGDTLSRIARHFGIRVDPLSELNRVSANAVLRAGTTVLLPIPSDRGRSAATLDIRDPPERKRVRRGKRPRSSKDYKISFKKREAYQSIKRIRDDDT